MVRKVKSTARPFAATTSSPLHGCCTAVEEPDTVPSGLFATVGGGAEEEEEYGDGCGSAGETSPTIDGMTLVAFRTDATSVAECDLYIR